MKQQTPFEKRILNLALYFLGTNFVFQLIIFIPYLQRYSVEEVLSSKAIEISFFVNLFTLIVLLLMNWKVFTFDFKQMAGKWWTLLLDSFKYYVFIIFANIIITFIITNFIGVESVSNQVIIENELIASPIFVILLSVVFAPIVEEVVFRYSLMDVDSNNKQNQTVWWIVSAVLFGMLHMVATLQSGNLEELWFFFQYFSMGLIIGHSYLKYTNIWAPIMVHFVNNGISILLLLLL